MESIGFSLDDLDFVVGAFQWTGPDGELAMVQDSVFEESRACNEPVHGWMVYFGGHLAPLVQCVFCPAPASIMIDHLQLVFQLIHGTESFIDCQ